MREWIALGYCYETICKLMSYFCPQTRSTGSLVRIHTSESMYVFVCLRYRLLIKQVVGSLTLVSTVRFRANAFVESHICLLNKPSKWLIDWIVDWFLTERLQFRNPYLFYDPIISFKFLFAAEPTLFFFLLAIPNCLAGIPMCIASVSPRLFITFQVVESFSSLFRS